MHSSTSQRGSSMVFAPELQTDAESATWTYFKSYEWGYQQPQQQNQESAQAAPPSEKAKSKDIIERLSGVIDTEESRFEKVKEESYQQWETQIENQCEQINNEVEQFYQRQNFVFDYINVTADEEREQQIPEQDEHETCSQMQELATSSWQFQGLSGQTQMRSIDQIQNLNNKLQELEPMSMFGEPIDIINGGPEFFEKCRDILLTKNSDIVFLSETLVALFGVVSLSANHDLILNAIDIMLEFNQVQDQNTVVEVFDHASTRMQKFLEQICQKIKDAPYQHSFHQNSVSRTFGIASMFSPQSMNCFNSSLTSDGTYLYLATGLSKRANLYKIGSGDNQTIPGKVYHQAPLDREGELTWVHCQNRLFLRYQQSELGLLHIYCPQTLQKIGEAKLYLQDLTSLAALDNINKNYPLLVDPTDNTLCIVLNDVEKRKRSVLPEEQKEHALLETQKQKELKEPPPQKNQEEQEKEKERLRQEMQKRKNERQRRKEQPAEQQPVIQNYDYSHCSILQHKLFKFDVSSRFIPPNTSSEKESELLKNPLVQEMYQTFSGYFKIHDCARALKQNKDDIEAAANYLVLEKEKPDQIIFRRVASQLLCESQLQSAVEAEKQDWALMPGALLHTSSVCPGRWTINQGQITYHHVLPERPEIQTAVIFSTQGTNNCEQRVNKEISMIESISRRVEHSYASHNSAQVARYYWIEDKWVRLTDRQMLQKLEAMRANDQNTDSIQEEEKFYEPVLLKNALITQTQRTRPFTEQNYQNYLTYCATSTRFYLMPVGHPQRLILSAYDLQHQKSASYDQQLQRSMSLPSKQESSSSFQNPIRKSYTTTEQYEKTSFLSFTKQTLEVLLKANEVRFRLPWRWNQWHLLFKQAQSPSQPRLPPAPSHLFGFNHESLGSLHMHEREARIDLLPPLSSSEQSKPAQKRLKKRHSLLKDMFIEQLLKEAGYQNNLTDRQVEQFKQKVDKIIKQQKREFEIKQQREYAELQEQCKKVPINRAGVQMQPGQGPRGEKHKLYCGRNLGPRAIPGSDGRCGPTNGPQCQDCLAVAHEFQAIQLRKSQLSSFLSEARVPNPLDDVCLPEDLVCVPVELAKQYAFCVSGNLQSLDTLLKIYEKEPKLALESCLQWITHASWLTSHNPVQIQKLYQICINTCKTAQSPLRNLAMRILVVGWEYFTIDASKQLEIIHTILQDSDVDKEQTAFATLDLLNPEIQMSGGAALQAKLCIQPSFYDLEVLNQRNIQNYFFVLRGTSINSSPFPGLKKMRSEDMKDKIQLKGYIKQKWNSEDEEEPSMSMLGGYTQSQYKLTEVPLEYIDVKRLQRIQSQNPTTSQINPSFFNMPQVMVLAKEIVNEYHTGVKAKQLDRFLVKYTSSELVFNSHEEKYQTFLKLREEYFKKQDELKQLFKNRFAQGCHSTSAVYSHFMGIALNWIDFKVPSHSSQIAEALEVAIQHPSLPLISQILRVLGNIGSQPNAQIAHQCLPKLISLISTLSKTKFKIDESVLEGIDESYDKVFETQHPYNKTEQKIAKQIKCTGAIGYIVEFDKRCSVETSHDVLTLKSGEFNHQIAGRVGTEFRFDHAPGNESRKYVMFGKQLDVEFRWTNPRSQGRGYGRGRGGGGAQPPSNSRDEFTRRWGYKLNIKPIYGMPRILEGDQQHVSVLNNLVQKAAKLSCDLVEGNFFNNEQVSVLPETKQAVQKVLNWHLFKGGLIIPDMMNSFEADTIIQQGLQQMGNSAEQTYEDSIKSLAKEPRADEEIKSQKSLVDLKSQKTRQVFESEESVWSPEVKALLESAQLKKVIQRIRIQQKYPQSYAFIILKEESENIKYKSEWEQIEQLLVVTMLYHSGSLSDVQKYIDIDEAVVKKGFKQMEPQDETGQLLEQFLMIGKALNQVLQWMLDRLSSQKNFQDLINSTLDQAQTLITDARIERETYLKQQAQIEYEREKKMAEERAQMEEEERLMREHLKKLEEEKKPQKQQVVVSGSKQKGNNKKRANVVRLADQHKSKKPVKSKPQQQTKQTEETEETKEEVKEEVPDQEKTELAQYLDLPLTQLIDLKSKILSTTYNKFVSEYHNEEDFKKLISLCMFFDFEFQPSDVAASLQAVFKKVKHRIQSILDLNDTESEAQQIPNTVNSKVLKLGAPAQEVAQDVRNRLLLLLELKPSFNYLAEVTRITRSKTKMSVIAEQDEELASQMSGHLNSQVSHPDSDFDDDDLDDLPPLQPQRALSLPATIQTGIMKLAAPQQNMTRQKTLQRTRKQSEEYALFIDSYRKWRLWAKRSQEEENDLLSPQGSPLYSIVKFAQMQKVSDTNYMRAQMRQHVIRAAFRLQGLQYQEKMYREMSENPLMKFLWGTKGLALHKSVLHEVETCGEQITRQLNQTTRVIVQQLMQNFDIQIRQLASKSAALRPSKTSRKLKDKENQEASQPLVTLTDCKRILLTLNDIRVLMSNSYTREYVLESLRADKHISTRNTLGVDQIKTFLRAAVSILVRSHLQQSLPYAQIAKEAKLVLRLFTTSTLIKTETQRILQEMLLDTVVSQLEQEHNRTYDSSRQSKKADALTAQQISITAILKLLSEVLRIPKDEQVLQPQKAQGCIKLLSQLITSKTETPAVVRQALKCAKLLTKQLSGQDLSLETDVLKAIGQKIQIEKPQEESAFANYGSDVAQDEVRENKESKDKETHWMVMLHCNTPHEEDFTFLVSALWEFEKKHKLFSNKLHKSKEEIIKQVPKPQTPKKKPQAEEKKSEQKSEQKEESKNEKKEESKEEKKEEQKEEQKEENKEEQKQADKDKEKEPAQVFKPPEPKDDDWISDDNAPEENKERIPRQIADRLSQDRDRIMIQMRELMEALPPGDSQDRDHLDNEMEGLARQLQELDTIMLQHQAEDQEHGLLQMYQSAYGRGPPGMPVPAPARHSSKAQSVQAPAQIKLQHVLNAHEEIKKNWQQPLSTDTPEQQQKKFDERNYQILSTLILTEAVQLASYLFGRNSMIVNRTLTYDQAVDFSRLLQQAYAGKLKHLQQNPYSSEEDLGKVLSCIPKTKFIDLFPVDSDHINKIQNPNERPGACKAEKIQVAPKCFSCSIIQKHTVSSLEKEMHSKLIEIKACQKSQRLGPIVHSRSQKLQLGFSVSQIIQLLTQFVRSIPSTHLNTILNQTLSDFLLDKADKDLLYGVITTVGGWAANQSIGTNVEVNINEQWYRATVVDGGLGKKQVTVILDDDDSLTLHKVAHKKVKTYQEPVELKPDQKVMIQAIIKAKREDKFLLCQMLRACAQMKLELSKQDPEYEQFLKILVGISSSGDVFNEDKSQKMWEKQMMLDWERLIECREQKNYLFQSASEDTNEQLQAQDTQALIQNFAQNEYIQLCNSYLQGLPDIASGTQKAKSRLKLLHYWEKNVIPTIIQFCQGTFQPSELKFSIAQVRYYLKQNFMEMAMQDTMTLLENRLPPGLVIPDENHDWSAKIIDECIVGQWVLAKIKQKGSSESNSQFSLVMNKLQSLGIEEILVQIKATDARSSAVLAEFTDYDMMQTHYVWIPATNLLSLQQNLPYKSQNVPEEQLRETFEWTVQKVASIYSRRTLESFVHQSKEIPVEELKFEDLIGWSVWETFHNDAVNGWMQDIPQVLSLDQIKNQSQQKAQAKQKKTLTQLLNQSIEKIAKENLQSQQKVQSEKEATTSLFMLAEMLRSDTQKQKKMLEWTSTLWYTMAQSVAQNRCSFDLIEQYEKFNKTSQQSNALLPLHDLLPNKGDNSIGNILQFKKGGIKLSPCARISFFSDPDQVNLIQEYFAGHDIRTEIPPLTIENSRVWVHCYGGTGALLLDDQQQMLKQRGSALETAVVAVPKEWQIACWLTDTLTTIEIERSTLSAESGTIFKQLISGMISFYEDAKAPNILKSCILKLLARLIIKLRYLYSKIDDVSVAEGQSKAKTHQELTSVTSDFLQSLLSEIMIQMESTNTLHGQFVQDSVEFMMSYVIPVRKNETLETYRDVIPNEIQIPEWMVSSLKLSFYLHFFRNDLSSLPNDMVKIDSNYSDFLQNIIAFSIKDLPKDIEHAWLLSEVKEILKAHQALVLNPETDLLIFKDKLIIILDGWHPLKPQEPKEVKDSDDEKDQAEEVKAPEIPPLTSYNCPACTLENPISQQRCGICEGPRPPLAQLEEEWKAQHAPKEEEKKDSDEIPLTRVRLTQLCKDLKQIVSRKQRQQLIEKQQAQPVEKVEEEKKAEVEEEQKEVESSESEEIDLDNLPQDRNERHRILNLDVSFADPGDEPLIQAMEASVIEDIRKSQEKKAVERQKRREERARLQKDQLALKRKQENERLEKMMKKDGGSAGFLKFNVKFGKAVFSDDDLKTTIQELLQTRFKQANTNEFIFSPQTKEVIAQIHKNWQQFNDLSLPEADNEDSISLEDFAITAETIKQQSITEFEDQLLTVVMADSQIFVKFLYSQGYDYWLTQTRFPSKPSAKQLQRLCNIYLLEKLKHLVEHDMCQENKLVTQLESNELRILSLVPQVSNSISYYDETLVKDMYPDLIQNITQHEARYMWAMLQQFNQFYAPVIPFVQQQSTQATTDDILPLGIAAYISLTRDLCFNAVKSDLRQMILDKTTCARENPPKLQFERLRLAQDQDSKEEKKEQKEENSFMFSTACDQVKDFDLSLLRPEKPRGTAPHIAFEIVFKNEHVVGEAGPYRQFFADVSKELQPSGLERAANQKLLDLLAPSANQVGKEQTGKGLFVVNSQAVGQRHLSQFEFLGVLMGVCIRTGATLMLDLPQVFWKELVGQKINLDDLYEIDLRQVRKWKDMLNYPQETFDAIGAYFWSTPLADGTEINLKPDGADVPVEYNEIEDYIQKCLETRLNESQAQYQAIKRGISKIIPPSILNIVTSKELEIWICGKNFIDVDLLQRHTKYTGVYNEDHPTIKMFWQFLTSLEESDKQKFIKFCWGQERIPANDQSFEEKNVRFMVKQVMSKNNASQDLMLPKADTCFFNLELPNYSSIETMKKKIMQAITLDNVSMNAEENQVGGGVQGLLGNGGQPMDGDESY